MNRATDTARAARLFAEIHPPLNDSEAGFEAGRCLGCGGPLAPAPCTAACPARVDVARFMREITEGRSLDAAKTIFDANVLGGSCSRVCPVAILCEGACVLKKEGRRPVTIGQLQCYATDQAFQQAANTLAESQQPENGKCVGVIGAGPAGLACAAELAKLGYAVTVYEQRHMPGGLIVYGIAPYKQRIDPLLQEVQAIRELGVEFRFGVTVGMDVPLGELEARHDAIFAGVGLGEDLPAGLPGEDLPGVWESLDFIEQIKLGRLEEIEIGQRVAVIGGGNTAIDVAREAVRLGASDVMMVYRRTEEQMPAYAHEVTEAKAEGVRFLWLTAPVKLIGDAKVRAIECIHMKLGAPDKSGRPRPEPVPGSEFQLEVDTVIKAIGQAARTDLLKAMGVELKGSNVAVNGRQQTSRDTFFAGGDCINGGGTVVEAVRHGKLAALGIHRRLAAPSGDLAIEQSRQLASTSPNQQMVSNNGIIEHYQGDYYLATERVLCKDCGLCVSSCPTSILYLNGKDKVTVKDMSQCVFCGMCEARCPDFAIWIVKKRPAGLATQPNLETVTP